MVHVTASGCLNENTYRFVWICGKLVEPTENALAHFRYNALSKGRQVWVSGLGVLLKGLATVGM